MLSEHVKDGVKTALSCTPPGGFLLSKGEHRAGKVLVGPWDPEQRCEQAGPWALTPQIPVDASVHSHPSMEPFWSLISTKEGTAKSRASSRCPSLPCRCCSAQHPPALPAAELGGPPFRQSFLETCSARGFYKAQTS